MRAFLLAAVAICALAQTPRLPRSGPLEGPAGRAARLEGRVLADGNGLPLRRVQVILSTLDGSRPAVATQTNELGAFVLRDIEPGAYQLTARRDGYLTTSVFLRGTARMPPRFTLSRADDIKNLTFRMRPWSVISGKIRFEDGDPAVGVQVQLYRRYHQRGRRGFAQVGATTTNDRGEYRAHGLPPGAYYVAVNYEGDRTGPDVEDQPVLDSNGNEIPVPSYTTTFYPETTNLSAALPVQLREADDLAGIDIYLRTVLRRKLKGRITDGVTGEILSSASVTLQRWDSANTGTLPVPIQLKFDADDQEFHIDDVAPGYYQLWVDAKQMMGRALVQVTNGDIDTLEIVVVPTRKGSGQVISAPGSQPLPPDFKPRITLEPRSERGAIAVPSVNGLKFEVSMMPLETYDLFIENLPESFYLAEIRVSGVDMRAEGLTGAMLSDQPFEVVLDSRGARIDGGVQGPGESTNGFGDSPWPGATITLIPDPPRNRLQSYRETYANEQGTFAFAGVPPGRYVMTAWFDEPPCDYYDEIALDACRLSGTVVDVRASGQQQIVLRMKPLPAR